MAKFRVSCFAFLPGLICALRLGQIDCCPAEIITIQVAENTPTGTMLSQLTGGIKYSIVSKSAGIAGEFAVDYQTGWIRVTRSPDRERSDGFCLDVQSLSTTDTAARMCRTLVMVEVLDVNDNAPKFRHEVYKLRTSCGVKGAYVGRVFATDVDSGRNAIIAYNLVGPNSDLFTVDQCTGIIRVRNVLPQRSGQSPETTLLARIRAHNPTSQPVLTDEATLLIRC